MLKREADANVNLVHCCLHIVGQPVANLRFGAAMCTAPLVKAKRPFRKPRRAQVGPSQKTLVNRGGLASVTVVAVTVISVAVIPVPFPLPLWLPLFPLLELLAWMRPVPSPSRQGAAPQLMFALAAR